MKQYVVFLALLLGLGCSASKSPIGRDSGPDDESDTGVVGDDDAGPPSTVDAGPPGSCALTPDGDGDGIPDRTEGDADPDGDGLPNSMDPDSDNDGIPDADEIGPNPCIPQNTDGDMLVDFIDPDSDNDGLSDAEEVALGTDPRDVDSDDDGVTDLGEVRGSMTDPNDATSTIDPDDFFVVLPFEDPAQTRTLRFGTALQRADVYFLIDTTASMGGPIENVRTSLSSIAAEVAARVPDVALGVGHYEDFPLVEESCIGPICITDNRYGAAGDVPYENVQAITSTIADVQSALNGLTLGNGADCAESGTEAVYQLATGAGGSFSGDGSSITMSLGCAATGIACPGFRDGSLPIVVFVSDAQWHNGNGGSAPYSGVRPTPATFDAAAAALSAIGARFIGVDVSGGASCRGSADLRAMATRTGSVDGSGSPLVYEAPAGSVSTAIVDGIAALASSTPQDVNTRRENVPGNPDDFDATRFIQRVTPLAAYGPDGAAVTLTMDDTTFYAVTPGTEVEFEVEFENTVREPPELAEIHRAVIVVVGNGVTDLDRRDVYIVVPPADAEIILE